MTVQEVVTLSDIKYEEYVVLGYGAVSYTHLTLPTM
jgi:hypothetical protein